MNASPRQALFPELLFFLGNYKDGELFGWGKEKLLGVRVGSRFDEGDLVHSTFRRRNMYTAVNP